jgi:GT2 family glycosyltransferase
MPRPTASRPTDPVVSVLVISYNTRALTLACLRSVAGATRLPHEVIVVDNDSRDGSAVAIAEEHPEVRLVARPDNLGFAGGNNLAAGLAAGEYLLLLNPDTVVLEGAIDRLVAFARARPEAGIWGGRTIFADGSLNPSSCWRRMTLWNVFCRTTGLTGIFPRSALLNAEAYGGWERDSERAVDIVQGCYLLIRRELWQSLGGFDPVFFMYGDDADLCLRARALGARPRMTPDSVIVHYGGASEPVRADKMVRLLTAKTELVTRHFPAWQRPLGRLLFRLWPLTRLAATGALATATNRPAPRAAYATWAEVWARRAVWARGYTGRPATVATRAGVSDSRASK